MVFSVVKRTPYFLRWNCAERLGPARLGPPHEFAAVHHVLTSAGDSIQRTLRDGWDVDAKKIRHRFNEIIS